MDNKAHESDEKSHERPPPSQEWVPPPSPSVASVDDRRHLVHGGRTGDTEVLMPLDDQYPSFSLQPEPRHFLLPGHVDVSFADTFRTPESHQMSSVSKTIENVIISKGLGAIYRCFADSTYYALTILIGSVLAAVWAIVFGLMSFTMVWVVQPSLKLHYIVYRVFGHLYSATIRTFIDPIIQSFALCFSYFRLRLNILPGNHPPSYVDSLQHGGHRIGVDLERK